MTRLKRCKHCNRPIRDFNKTGYCCGCRSNRRRIERNRQRCNICEEPCSGKMLIEVRKGTLWSFCTYHFNLLNSIKDIKDIRKKIKYLKSYH